MESRPNEYDIFMLCHRNEEMQKASYGKKNVAKNISGNNDRYDKKRDEQLSFAYRLEDEREKYQDNDRTSLSSRTDCTAAQQELQKKSRYAEIKDENVSASKSAHEKYGARKEPASEQARHIVIDTLEQIAARFHINTDFTKQLHTLDFASPGNVFIEQFSEILVSLKGISELLGKAVCDNTALDIKGCVIEPAQAAALEQFLQNQIFRLEAAFQQCGIAAPVSSIVAEKMNTSLISDRAIPVASDPSTLTMPQSHQDQIFHAIVKTGQEKILEIIQRIAALAKEHDGVEQQVLSKTPDSELQFFNTGIMRRLLKIDSHEEKMPGNGENPDTAKHIASPLFSALSLPVKDGLSPTSGGDDIVSGLGNVTSLPQSTHTASDIRQQVPVLQKHGEEMVMRQITERLISASKNGVHEVRLLLKPETLGDIRMSIQVEGDVVVARFSVENQQVKQIIESNLQNLRDSLAEHNLEAGTLDVNIDQGSEKGWSSSSEFKKSRNSDNAGDGESVDTTVQSVLFKGHDTGRRYGLNTIEYFA